ncbi:DUF6370 family protein [Pedobacter sp.]|uniref:DUF6370 family protein n=1 Tax=Pedobacter sp. TaxID=1411316 RepID=UPI0031D80B08
MKKLSLLILFASFTFLANAQTTPSKASAQKVEKKTVEIACGECMFKMPGKGCDLAVKIDGTSYFVDGRKIDDFGDAHADDGFCNAVRKATVTGEVVDGRFKAKSIQLVEEKKTSKPKS